MSIFGKGIHLWRYRKELLVIVHVVKSKYRKDRSKQAKPTNELTITSTITLYKNTFQWKLGSKVARLVFYLLFPERCLSVPDTPKKNKKKGK